MEKLKPLEVLPLVGNLAVNGLKFVVEQLKGGGWSDLPHGEPAEAKPPVRANITYYTTKE